MSDVVAVALISGGLSLLSAALGAVTTYRVNKRSTDVAIETAQVQTDATIKTAQAQADVELEKVKAENQRLQVQHQEDERRNRQGTYQNAIAQLYRFAGAEPGQMISNEEADEMLRE